MGKRRLPPAQGPRRSYWQPLTSLFRGSTIRRLSLARFLVEALDSPPDIQHRSAYVEQQLAQNLQFLLDSRLCRGRVKHKPILSAGSSRLINDLLNFLITEPGLAHARIRRRLGNKMNLSDSPLEGSGFEPSAPRKIRRRLKPPYISRFHDSSHRRKPTHFARPGTESPNSVPSRSESHSGVVPCGPGSRRRLLDQRDDLNLLGARSL
jgi:hypothetical protein